MQNTLKALRQMILSFSESRLIITKYEFTLYCGVFIIIIINNNPCKLNETE